MAKAPLHSTGDASRLSCVARQSHMPNMLPSRALSDGRLAVLCATRGFTTDCWQPVAEGAIRQSRSCARIDVSPVPPTTHSVGRGAPGPRIAAHAPSTRSAGRSARQQAPSPGPGDSTAYRESPAPQLSLVEVAAPRFRDLLETRNTDIETPAAAPPFPSGAASFRSRRSRSRRRPSSAFWAWQHAVSDLSNAVYKRNLQELRLRAVRTALVGEGGMGHVYRATDTRLDRMGRLIPDVSDGPPRAVVSRASNLAAAPCNDLDSASPPCAGCWHPSRRPPR